MTDADRFDRLSELFEAARAVPQSKRAEFLTGACADDPVLREEVESLLEAHEKASPLDSDTPGVIAGRIAEELETDQVPMPTMLGRYRVVRQIGEGGMGAVYEATQQDPDRTVAIKVIKLGMDTRQVVARFEHERQALAIMDHPCIARVFDGGMSETGRPFFVMEHVQGQAMTRYADEHRLGTRARLALVTQVCYAIQHAHQKGVIHRDIKPSNVLVTELDGTPTPKVIDFGIAKATDAGFAPASLITLQGQAVGTPAHMAPEQAGAVTQDVDTRADVYSLGVLLYELLTGTTPFDQREIESKGLAEMLRVIREDDPERPSTRLSSMGDQATRVAAQRDSDEPTLRSQLAGDLDWIVMKCLEKDRENRYDSAAALADDIVRYLANEPVMARPPSAGYRFRKYVKRNRGQVVAGFLTLGLLLLAVVGTTSGMIWALSERERAEVAAIAEAQAKVKAYENAEQAKIDADIARELSDFFVMDVLSAVNPARTENRDLTVREALEQAADRIDGRFDGRPEVETNIQNALGFLFSRLGDPGQAEVHQRRLVELAEITDGPGSIEVARTMHGVVGTLAATGRHSEAIEMTLEQLAILEHHDGPEAEEWRIRGRGNLGALYTRAGKPDQAVPYLEASLEAKKTMLGETHPSTLAALNNLAAVYSALGRPERALELAGLAHQGRRELLGEGDPRTYVSLINLAGALVRLGRDSEAIERLTPALQSGTERLGSDHPTVVDLGNALASAFRSAGREGDAEQLYRSNLMVQNESDPERLQPRTLEAMRGLAQTLSADARHAEAEPFARAALEGARSAYPPGNVSIEDTLRVWVRTLLELGQLDDAERVLRDEHERNIAAYGADDVRSSKSERALSEFREARTEAESAQVEPIPVSP